MGWLPKGIEEAELVFLADVDYTKVKEPAIA
jgi:hypothetical protein